MKENKLLVVVDMQNDFVTGSLANKDAEAIIDRMVDFVKDYEGEVVFTKDTHQEDYLDTQEGKKLPVVHCIEGTEGWEIVDKLQPFAKDAKIFLKNTFGDTGLGQYIAELGYDRVDFVGVCTGICVISNAMLAKAFSPQTPIYVHADLCACVTKESHETALNAMKCCQIDVV